MPRVDEQRTAAVTEQAANIAETAADVTTAPLNPAAGNGHEPDGLQPAAPAPAIPATLWVRPPGERPLARETTSKAASATPGEPAGLQLIAESFFLAIMEAIEAREPFAKGRARSVARYAAALADMLLPPEDVNTVRVGALLSDIGMVSVPEAILQKTDTLTPEEQLTVRKHPVFGAEILMNVPQLKSVVPLVLHHHEDYNGAGYPYGLSGDWIPYGARIIRVADSYDALTSLRPYRAAYSAAEALNILSNGADAQFDPRIVTAFRLILRRGPIKDEVLDRWSDLRSAARVSRQTGSRVVG